MEKLLTQLLRKRKKRIQTAVNRRFPPLKVGIVTFCADTGIPGRETNERNRLGSIMDWINAIRKELIARKILQDHLSPGARILLNIPRWKPYIDWEDFHFL